MNDDLATLVAANPFTDPSLLEELVIKATADKNTEMQRAIASHPNTPTRWLIRLAALFPEEFFNNPAYNLQILENINYNYLFNKK